MTENTLKPFEQPDDQKVKECRKMCRVSFSVLKFEKRKDQFLLQKGLESGLYCCFVLKNRATHASSAHFVSQGGFCLMFN